MTITPYKNTLKDGTQKTYFKVTYRDEFGKKKSRSFADRREAKEFDGSIVEITRQKAAAIAAGVDPDEALAKKVLDGSINGSVLDRVNARSIEPTRKVRQAIDDFIDACVRGRENHKAVRPQTAKTYREKMYALRDMFGDRQVGSIGVPDAREYRDHLIEKCSTRMQAKNCLVVAKMMFQWLIDDVGELKTNPFSPVRIVTGDEDGQQPVTEDEIYTDEEIEKLMQAAYAATGHNRYAVEHTKDLGVMALMIYCGLRIGEALAMEWEDVDLDAKVVTVKQTLTKTMTINATKTKQGFRTIALHPKAVEALKIAKSRAVGKYVSSVQPQDPSAGDRPTQYRNMKRAMDRLIKDAGIPKRGPHSLRHFFASKLIEAGYDAISLRRQIGHADLAFTDRVYGHLLNKRTRVTKDVDRMAEVSF